MKTKIENILQRFSSKIMWTDYYNPAKTVKNDWVGDIKDCVAHVEILDYGVDAIVYALCNAGYTIKYVGREIYIIQN